MTVAALVVAGSIVAALRRHRDLSDEAAICTAALFVGASVVGVPLTVTVAAAVAAGHRQRRMSRRRRREAAAEADVTLLGELVLLGVEAGLTFPAALRLAADEVDPGLRREVVGLLRRSHRFGTAATFQHATGRARRLYLLAGRAATTGAPIADAVASFVEERRAEERTRRRSESARLPVRLLVPLSLLILPGFVLLTVGPTLLGAVRRLGLLAP